jgi:hypothetical protein
VPQDGILQRGRKAGSIEIHRRSADDDSAILRSAAEPQPKARTALSARFFVAASVARTRLVALRKNIAAARGDFWRY